MVPASSYKFLPHTTDAYVEATGATFEQALENAGMALFDTMCEIDSIWPIMTDAIEFEGEDEVTLLYDWLESLLLKFELERKVYSKLRVGEITKSSNLLRGTARLSGETYDRARHKSKVEVKGVTYHKMEITHDKDSTTIRYILDL